MKLWLSRKICEKYTDIHSKELGMLTLTVEHNYIYL